ncbi:hypothetical protein ES703_77550 [subsurface metagenome]
MHRRFIGLFLGTVLLIESAAAPFHLPNQRSSHSASRNPGREQSAHTFIFSLTDTIKAPSKAELVESEIGRKERVKTQEELRLESVIDRAYRRCFKTYQIAGRPIRLRIPFGQNGERPGRPEFYQHIFLGGKGFPREIWAEIGCLLETEDFEDYIHDLKHPKNKVLMFNLEDNIYSINFDNELVEELKYGPYPGSRVFIFVLKTDSIISGVDIYNYLYCVGAVGMDCCGFIYYIQRSIAQSYCVELDEILSENLNRSPENVPQLIGLCFFNPEEHNVERVEDKIENLRPGDIFLFRGRGGIFRHSAVIQSIDFKKGVIRYIQCTDWAPQAERGVHESFINFDPSNPGISLKHRSVQWTQEIYPTFEGEAQLKYWKNDGDRYRAYWETGRSVIVRLKLIRDLIIEADPLFYRTVF